jgi:8-oxo-dGTP pyrophosphatase MutT (NUDIX family)
VLIHVGLHGRPTNTTNAQRSYHSFQSAQSLRLVEADTKYRYIYPGCATMKSMKQAVRAVIVRDGNLLVMHRNKFGQQYYTLVGGGIDSGEHPEQSLRRELMEEAGLQLANPRLTFVEDAGDFYGVQYVFVCDYAGGEIAMHPDADEAKIGALGQNIYTPMWLPIADLPAAPFISEALKQRIIAGLRDGWPDISQGPVRFKTEH